MNTDENLEERPDSVRRSASVDVLICESVSRWKEDVDRINSPNRPAVLISFAQSMDGSLTSERGKSTALSCAESLRLTHALRASCDAILVGISTVLADNPSLTVRHWLPSSQPHAVIFDSSLRVPPNAKVLKRPDSSKCIIVTSLDADVAKEAALRRESAGVVVMRIARDQAGHLDLASALLQLKMTQGISSVMIEGGAQIITSALAARIADRVVVTLAPVFLGGYACFSKTSSAPAVHLDGAKSTCWKLGVDFIFESVLNDLT